MMLSLARPPGADDVHVGQIVLGVRIAESCRRVLEEPARPLGIRVNVAVGNAGEAVDADRDEGVGDRAAVSLVRRVLVVVLDELIEVLVGFHIVARDADAVGVHLAELPARDRLPALRGVGQRLDGRGGVAGIEIVDPGAKRLLGAGEVFRGNLGGSARGRAVEGAAQAAGNVRRQTVNNANATAATRGPAHPPLRLSAHASTRIDPDPPSRRAAAPEWRHAR